MFEVSYVPRNPQVVSGGGWKRGSTLPAHDSAQQHASWAQGGELGTKSSRQGTGELDEEEGG